MSDSGERPYTVRIGHIRLKVADLARSIEFYTRYLHMRVVEQPGGDFAFLSGGDPHHEIALMKVDDREHGSRSPNQAGFDHVAFELPGKREFALAFTTLSEAGIPLRPVDNGISWGMYFSDPEGNLLELFCDTRYAPGGRALWEGRTIELTPEVIKAALAD